MNSIPVIAVGGRARGGKDTVARVVMDAAHYLSVAFAAPLKAYGAGLMEISVVEFDRRIKEQSELRRWMQEEGDLVKRRFGEDVLIRRAASRIDMIRNTRIAEGVIVTDLRTPAEARFLRNTYGATLWCVRRPPHDGELTGELAAHETETALDKIEGWDHVIVNDGTPEELEAKVIQALGRITPCPTD